MNEVSVITEAHSRIGASSMHRWAKCPGSVKLSVGIPSTTSVYAQEGTTAHDIAAKFLQDTITPGAVAAMSDEMANAIATYIEVVMRSKNADAKNELLVETKFDLSSIHPGLFGTADAIVYHPKKKLLEVFDFKYGAGIQVDVEENEQLMYYGLGALIQTGYPAETIELVISQPRVSLEEKRWSFDAIDILDFAADLKVAAEATEKENAPLVPGEHCRFCPAAATKCPKLREISFQTAQMEFKPTLSYDPQKLSKALNMIDTMKAWIKATEDFAESEALQGRVPPGFKLVEKRATRKWTNEQEAVEIAKKLKMEKDIWEEPSIKSVAAMEKFTGKKLFKEFESLVSKESSGVTLVPESDKRPPAKIEATEEFKRIENVNNNEDLFN